MTLTAAPFDRLPRVWRLVLLAVLAAATVGIASRLKAQAAPLEGVLDHGIVSLELPGSAAKAEALLTALRRHGLVDTARQQVRFDFVFLTVYPLLFSLACGLLAAQAGGRLRRRGVAMAWAVLLCAPLDALENVGILGMLDGRTAAPWPQLTTLCAGLKFALLAGALLLIGAMAAARVVGRWKK